MKLLKSIIQIFTAKKIRLLIHLVTFLFFIFSSFNYLNLFYSILMYFILGRIGADLGFHRYFSHDIFIAHPIVSRILLVLGTLSLRGSLISWVSVHKSHHQFADTDQDPHPGLKSSYLNLWLANIKPQSLYMSKNHQFFKDKWVVFIHKNYSSLILIFILVFISINLELFIYFYALPIIYLSFASFLTSTICHKWGYRNFDTNDKSTNNLLIQIITLGGGLHNNHHAKPNGLTQKIKWFEFDFLDLIIKLLLWTKLVTRY